MYLHDTYLVSHGLMGLFIESCLSANIKHYFSGIIPSYYLNKIKQEL